MSISERSSGPTRERWLLNTRVYERWEFDILVETREFNDAENAWVNDIETEREEDKSKERLINAVRAAHRVNVNYILLATSGRAVLADHVKQILMLTREVDALLRLYVGKDMLIDDLVDVDLAESAMVTTDIDIAT